MRICDFIISYLKKHADLKHLFTYAGGTNAMLLDSAARQGDIRIIPMRHEENAALAADGYAKIKKKHGFALSMSGPGATNMVTGIAQSFFDSTPVLFLTGNVTTTTYKYDLPMRQLGYQETDIVSIVRPITKNAYFADQVGQVAQKLRAALRDCVIQRPGPALFDIPFDTQKLEIDEGELNKPYLESRANYSLNDAVYQEFVSLLQNSKKPVILAGGGIQIADSQEALLSFAKRFNLPVVHTLLGKDAFPNDNPLYVGFAGSYGNRHANHILAGADLVIALGCRLSSRQTAKVADFSKNKKIIHVDIDPSIIGHNVAPALGINMDIGDFFRDFALKDTANPMKWTTPEGWLSAVSAIIKLLSPYDMTNENGLNPKEFLKTLTLTQQPDTIYSVDVGGHQMWSSQSCIVKKGGRMLFSGGLGTMGYGIPAAIGAHFAAPEKNIIAICGDGGFQMSLPELQTIKEFNVPVKIIVINNEMLGLMKNFQDENFDGLHIATVIGYSVPDICKLAEVYGLKNRRLTEKNDMNDAIIWLNEEKGPLLLELKIPKTWGPYPKVLPGAPLTKQHPPLPSAIENKAREILG